MKNNTYIIPKHLTKSLMRRKGELERSSKLIEKLLMQKFVLRLLMKKLTSSGVPRRFAGIPGLAALKTSNA